MKIAMMSYTLARGAWGASKRVDTLCAMAQELGLDAVDWVTTYGHDPKTIRAITDDHGLANICYTFPTRIHSPETSERQAALDRLSSEFETAATLGADKVMIVVGGLPDVSRDVARRYALEGLARAVAIGDRHGITVTIEHFGGPNSPFNTSSEMNGAVQAVPGLKITFDNGNLYTSGEAPADGFRASRDHIAHAHFKDWTVAEDGVLGRDGRHYRGALVGEGLVDPKPCLEAMHEAGYEGYIDFEYEGDLYTPEDALRKGVPRLKELIDAIQG